jgi:hypothetical protein
MTIDVMVVTYPLGVSLPLLLYLRGRCYKKCNRVDYNMIPIRTLSLLTYFTYIFIDIIIYALGARHGPLKSSGWWDELYRTLFRPSESMRGGTMGTNPRQHHRVLNK